MYRLRRFSRREEYLQELGMVSALISKTGDPETSRELREYRLQLEQELFFFTAQKYVIY